MNIVSDTVTQELEVFLQEGLVVIDHLGLGQGRGVEPLGSASREHLHPGPEVGRLRGRGELTVLRRLLEAFEKGCGIFDHGNKGENRLGGPF